MAKQIDSIDNPLVFLKQFLNLAKVRPNLVRLDSLHVEVLDDINDSNCLDLAEIHTAVQIISTDAFIIQVQNLNTEFMTIKSSKDEDREKNVFNLVETCSDYQYLFATSLEKELLQMEVLKSNMPSTAWQSIKESWHG
ncbi:hypothetical protein [Marinicellulosiphila megalodicopiae]|uniref:hypothetical protein n=1 Tax=Marinicellulosiphila megalodicopiae TaxID=2724896 RepID=UPI003BB065F5